MGINDYLEYLNEQQFPEASKVLRTAYRKYVDECPKAINPGRVMSRTEEVKMKVCKYKARRRALRKTIRYIDNRKISYCRKYSGITRSRCKNMIKRDIENMQREVTKLNNEIYRGESSIGRV
jgi:hypothetical protein